MCLFEQLCLTGDGVEIEGVARGASGVIDLVEQCPDVCGEALTDVITGTGRLLGRRRKRSIRG